MHVKVIERKPSVLQQFREAVAFAKGRGDEIEYITLTRSEWKTFAEELGMPDEISSRVEFGGFEGTEFKVVDDEPKPGEVVLKKMTA
jgi:hypothetical protein